MGRDLSPPAAARRPHSYFSGFMSPSACLPAAARHELGYTRVNACGGRRGKWRNLIKKIVREGKCSIYGSKPLSFQYDAVSYSQNFDDGCHGDDEPYYYGGGRRCHLRPAVRDFRWDSSHE